MSFFMHFSKYSIGLVPLLFSLGCDAGGAAKSYGESRQVDEKPAKAAVALPRVDSGESGHTMVYRFGAESLEVLDDAVTKSDGRLTRKYSSKMSPGCLLSTPVFSADGARQIVAEFRIKRDFIGALPHPDALANHPVVNINFNLESNDGESKVRYADLGFAPLQKRPVPELLATGENVSFYSAADAEYQSYVVKFVEEAGIRSGSIALCNAFYDVEFDLESIEVLTVK